VSSKIDISILLPTRGRTRALFDSIWSVTEAASDATRVEWILGFDNDDIETIKYFNERILPNIEESGASYTVLGFERRGYLRLNEYVNDLGKQAQGDWTVFWNDDAIMRTSGWDDVITSYTGRFCVQAFDTHKQHPYSIFPIVPTQWQEILGYLSPHQLSDAYISQIAWMMDIMVRIPVKVDHDRFDITGNNNDDTYQNRPMLEGNPNDPRDFNHITWRQRRVNDAAKIGMYLRSQGVDTDFWNQVLIGKQDPWEKMLAADVNKQMARLGTLVKK
jgi:hypothetical protein